MNLRRSIILAVYLVGTGLLSTFLISCGNLASEGMVIFTRVPADQLNFHKKAFTHQYPEAQIVGLDMDDLAGL